MRVSPRSRRSCTVAHQFTQIQIYTEEASEGRMSSVSIDDARRLWQVGVGHSEEERGRETIDGEDFYVVIGGVPACRVPMRTAAAALPGSERHPGHSYQDALLTMGAPPVGKDILDVVGLNLN
jgi:hypothetical protein